MKNVREICSRISTGEPLIVLLLILFGVVICFSSRAANAMCFVCHVFYQAVALIRDKSSWLIDLAILGCLGFSGFLAKIYSSHLQRRLMIPRNVQATP